MPSRRKAESVFPEGTRVPTLPVRKRWSRRHTAKPIEINPNIEEFVRTLRTGGRGNEIKIEVIRTLQHYESLGRPLDAKGLLAHFVILHGLSGEKLAPYAAAFNSLYSKKSGSIEGKPFVSGGPVFGLAALIRGGALEKLESHLRETGRIGVVPRYGELAKAAGVRGRDASLKISPLMQVLYAAGYAVKYPSASEREQYTRFIHSAHTRSAATVPSDNLDFSILKALRGNALSHNEIATHPVVKGVVKSFVHKGYGTAEPFAGGINAALLRLKEAGLIRSKPAPENKRETFTYSLSPRARRLLDKTLGQGFLEEGLRARLLGERKPLAVDGDRLGRLMDWAKVLHLRSKRRTVTQIVKETGVTMPSVKRILYWDMLPPTARWGRKETITRYLREFHDPILAAVARRKLKQLGRL